jgi:outer membrane protein TolC
MKSIVAKTGVSAFLLLGLGACAVQPETHADLPHVVQAVAPAAWSVDAPQDTVDANAWWARFGDPVLHQLVESVLNGNLDVQAAVERVKQAQAITTQQRSVLLPELDATATATDERLNAPPPLGYVRQAGVGVAASWTPDVFGGERLAVLAAQAQVAGREAALNELSTCAGRSRNCRY